MGDLIESREESPGDRLDRQEQADSLNRAIDALPDLYREVLILAYFQEMKYQEIADVLGLPLGTVKSRMHAAVGKLSEMLRPAQAGSEPASPALQPAGVKR
jgi:RNA polymerase sigma-70 factor (ECF subfamily)